MVSQPTKCLQDFLDSNQYSHRSILKYERIFGHTWVSTGGEKTSKDFLMELGLKPGQKVLDVGCGTGGSAFFMARHYGVQVHGVDLSTNMVNICRERKQREENIVQDRVKFEVGDIMEVQYENDSFDCIYSRDTILHIANKEKLYIKLHNWLKPGGILFITDYCRGNQEHTPEFLEYITGRGYDLRTVVEYGQVISAAGFKEVKVIDATTRFITILIDELKFFESTRDCFIKDFSLQDYNDILEGWRTKMVRCAMGDQAWGIFSATK